MHLSANFHIFCLSSKTEQEVNAQEPLVSSCAAQPWSASRHQHHNRSTTAHFLAERQRNVGTEGCLCVATASLYVSYISTTMTSLTPINVSLVMLN